jgi:hypothetical protein
MPPQKRFGIGHDGFYHFHYEEHVLADEIVILQIDDDTCRHHNQPLPAGFPLCAADVTICAWEHHQHY